MFCKRMTLMDVARMFGISKHTVYRIDKEGIQEELTVHKGMEPAVIGIDEISYKRGHCYATILTAPKARKVIDVLKGRRAHEIAGFFKGKSDIWCRKIKVVTMDAWLAYRKAVRRHCKNALVCFDHFHYLSFPR